MEVSVGRDVLVRFIVGPNQEMTFGGDGIARRDRELLFVVKIVGQEIASQINGAGARVVEFEPVVKLRRGTRRVRDCFSIARHPFVDEDTQGRSSAVVGAARGGVREGSAIEGLSVGVSSIGFSRGQLRVVEVIENLRRAIDQADQGHRACRAREAEAGVPLEGGGLPGLAVGEENLELSRRQRTRGRESPLGQIGVAAREVKAVQAQCVGARVVEFNPGIQVTMVVSETSGVAGLQFVQPDRRVWRQRCGISIGPARSGEDAPDRHRRLESTADARGEVRASRARQIPEAEGVVGARNHGGERLVEVGQGQCAAVENQVQTVVAGVRVGGGDLGVGGQGVRDPGSQAARFKIAVDDHVLARSRRHAALDQE